MKISVDVIAKILDMKLVLNQKLLSNVIAGNASILRAVIQILLWCFLKTRSVTVRNVNSFSRKDLETPVTRHFCDKCGTAIGTESLSRPNSMIVKVGTLTIQAHFGKSVIFYRDLKPYHYLPSGLPSFEKATQEVKLLFANVIKHSGDTLFQLVKHLRKLAPSHHLLLRFYSS